MQKKNNNSMINRICQDKGNKIIKSLKEYLDFKDGVQGNIEFLFKK